MSGGGFGRKGFRVSHLRFTALGAAIPLVPEVVPSVNPGRTSGAKGFSETLPTRRTVHFFPVGPVRA